MKKMHLVVIWFERVHIPLVWPAPAGFLALTPGLDTATETKDKQEEQSASLANSFHHKK